MRYSFPALAGRKIFITGHSGFTGSWATIWLNKVGANVFGYSLQPETNPNLFSEAKIGSLVPGVEADIRNFQQLQQQMHEFKPDLVLHLAAQPLVRRSYLEPKSTFETNTIGTANVLEAALNVPSVKGVLCITTDKVYKNSGLQKKYVEDDELGGLDPYSSSKAAAEFIISSYRLVLRTKGKATPLLAVARGGNIIGGGDWSEDRLIPDFIRSYNQGNSMKIRNPDAVRPWQHVVSLVAGYLNILSGMLGPEPNAFSKAFNLGPTESSSASVTQVLSAISQKLPGVKIEFTEEELHEDKYLEIDSTLAQRTFDWKPGWNQEAAIAKTAEWYMSFLSGKSDAKELCLRQIELWEKDIEELNT